MFEELNMMHFVKLLFQISKHAIIFLYIHLSPSIQNSET